MFKADNAACENLRIMTSASAGSRKTSEPVPFEAGSRAYFMLRLIGGYPIAYCYNVVSFEPVAGETYRATLHLQGARCDAEILTRDGVPAPGLQEHPAVGRCRF